MILRNISVVVAGLFAAIAAACSGRDADPCLPTVSGTVIRFPAIHLLVRDAYGQGQALDDTVIVYSRSDSLRVVGDDTLQIYAGFPTSGTFGVRVKRRFYRDALVSNVTVAGGACGGLVTTTVPVTLVLADGAPALRSVAVMGSTFITGPNLQSQLTARFDADSSVPRSVTWRLSDTTSARIDVNGLMTGKCITNVRPDTVSVIASADTTVRGRARFGVATQASCP